MKKTIKIKFIGFWPNFNPENFLIFSLLKEIYDVELSDEPDYVICSVFGPEYEYCKYPQVRIMYSGENYIPDLNLNDYSICSYPLKLLDRNFRLPVFMIYGSVKKINEIEKIRFAYDHSILDNKVYFANFIASHESENNIRGDFFKKLSEYKRVESCGSYLNNMPDGKAISYKEKKEFQKKCKFTLCFESTKHEGFITEKITDAFLSNTIPIYYGSSDAIEIFNERAFINVSDYKNFDEVLNKIIELDNNDNKYLEMLRQPIFVDPNYYDKTINELKSFLKNIFDQDIEKAYRRSRVYCAKSFDNLLNQKFNIEAESIKKSNIFKRMTKYLFNIFKRK